MVSESWQHLLDQLEQLLGDVRVIRSSLARLAGGESLDNYDVFHWACE